MTVGDMRILHHATLYRENRFHAAFPSIGRLPQGDLVLAFRRARDGLWLVPGERRRDFDPLQRMDHLDSRSHIALMALDRHGRPVDQPLDLLPFDPEAADQDPSLLILPEGDLLVAAFGYYPLPAEVDALLEGRSETADRQHGCRYLAWGCHVSRRGPTAGTWRYDHRYLRPDAGYGTWLGDTDRQPRVGAVRGQWVRHGDTLLLAVYWGVEEGCALFASGDHGETWHCRGTLAVDPAREVAYQEPALCVGDDGHLVCFMRTAGAGGRLATARSSDGMTWEPPRLHALVGHPFHPLRLRDGRVLLSYGFRDPPFGIRLRLLDGVDTDPDTVPEVVVRDDGLCRDIGYPWAVELDDGRVMLVYYWTGEDGMRGIEATWLSVEGA